ncbi:hypothetical protein FRB98_003359, partial [Tulasnella sp. 332]
MQDGDATPVSLGDDKGRNKTAKRNQGWDPPELGRFQKFEPVSTFSASELHTIPLLSRGKPSIQHRCAPDTVVVGLLAPINRKGPGMPHLLPSALATARHIDDLDKIEYSEGIEDAGRGVEPGRDEKWEVQ